MLRSGSSCFVYMGSVFHAGCTYTKSSHSPFQSHWKRFINVTVNHYTHECRPSFELINFCNFMGENFRKELLYKSTRIHGRALIFGQLNELDRDLAVIALPHIHTQLLD